jgi:CBS domain-containing protein
MALVHPSPTLMVRSNATLLECVRKMRDQGAGSILVFAESYPYALTGIFTERDLLRLAENLRDPEVWEKQISWMMRKPVVTLPILELDRAAEVMLTNRIRHLPVVYEDEDKAIRVAGVISMRDLFEGFVKKQALQRVKDLFAPTLRVGLVSREASSTKIFKAIFARSKSAELRAFAIEDLLTEAPPRELMQLTALIVDIDRLSAAAWTTLLAKLNSRPDSPHVVVVYDPSLHEPANVEKLETLSAGEKYSAFPKPFNILQILQHIQVMR